MKDKILLWPLLFDGKLQIDDQDPVVNLCVGEQDIASGCGWWGNRQGRGYGTNEADQRWLRKLWEEQACHQ